MAPAPGAGAPARTLLVLGIGAGDPGLLTLDAVAALGRADVVFVLDKGADLDELAALRRGLLERHARPDLRTVVVPDPPRDLEAAPYGEAVSAWHGQRVALLRDHVAVELADGGVGAFLVWGDPSLYDSTLRIVEDLRAELPWPVGVEVVPGISSLHLLTARHAIPLNRVGAAVRITTGRRLLEAPPGPDFDVVVFLDSGCRFTELSHEPLDLYWGAHLGSDHELLVAGPIAERAAEVVELRAAAKARHGWVFETYLLRWRG